MDTVTTENASAWLRGEGDLIMAAMGRVVPIPVQLGVLAHGSSDRLAALGRYRRRRSVRRAWGTDMASLAGEIARLTVTGEGLAHFQSETLVPLELEVLAGRRVFSSRSELIRWLRTTVDVEQHSHSASGSIV